MISNNRQMPEKRFFDFTVSPFLAFFRAGVKYKLNARRKAHPDTVPERGCVPQCGTSRSAIACQTLIRCPWFFSLPKCCGWSRSERDTAALRPRRRTDEFLIVPKDGKVQIVRNPLETMK